MKSRVLAILIVCLLALVNGAQAAATTYTFTPTTASTYGWTTGGNWSGGVPVSATDATVAFFPDVTTALTGAVTINTDPATLTLNTLTLNGLTAATAAANSIGTAGNTWTFGGTTPTVNLNGKSGATTLSYTLKPNIVLSQPLTFAGLGTAGLTLSGVISGLNTGITNNLYVGTITVNGAAVNTFTGGVNLNGGMITSTSGGTLLEDFSNLTASPNINLIDSGNVLTLGGGTLSLKGKNNVASSQTFASTTLSANTGSTIALARQGSGSMTVALQAITRNSGSALYFSTAPDASTVLATTSTGNEANGSGILGPWAFAGYARYAANNGSGQIIQYTSATPSAGGNLSDINNAAVNYSLAAVAGTTYTLSGDITGNTLLFTGAASTFTVANAGHTITLNGLIGGHSGTSTIALISGTGNLVIGDDNELVVNAYRPIKIDCPIVDKPGGYHSSLTRFDAGGNALTLSGTAPNTYSGITTVAGGILTLFKSNGVAAIPGNIFVTGGVLTCSANEQIADTANLTFSGTGQISSATRTETVNNVTILGNTTKFSFGSGSTFTINGTLSISNNNGAPAANFVQGTGGSGAQTWTVGAMNFDNSFFSITSINTQPAAFNLKGDFTGANSNTLTATATSTGTARFILNGTGTHNHNFNITSGTTTINGPIYQTNTASLTKTGAGTLTLTNANAYSGGTTVSNGTLIFQTSSSKPTTGSTSVAASTTLGLGVGGSGFFTSTDVDSLWANTLTNVTMDSAAIVGIDTSAGDFTYATSQSTRSLTKLGTNKLTLTGSHTYTGNTTVNAGTLTLDAVGSLKFAPTTNGVCNKVTGAGAATLNGTFNIDLTGAALASGNSWTLVDVTTKTSALTAVTGFTGSAGVWTKVDGGNTWTYTESTGVLGLVISSTSFSVTFDNNTGSGTMTAQTGSTAANLTANTFTKTGYSFTGWNTLANNTGTPYTDGASYPFTANTTLYAQWAAYSYTVTFDGNGGGSPSSTSKSVTYDSTYGTLATVTRTGYTFNGWFTAASGGTQVTSSTTVAITGAQTLYAQWTINTFTLTYTAGANGSITGKTPQTVDYNTSGAEVTAVAATGYHFVNWSDASTTNPRTDSSVTANVSVTANFAINTFTLTYTAGANGSVSVTSPQTVASGGSGPSVTAVAATGYHFVNWSDSSTSNPRTDSSVTANVSVTANFAINNYAYWLSLNSPATGFQTDTDGDGIPNGVENVLGSNPNAFNQGLTEVSSTANSVTFKHTLNPTAASDVTYGYRWSTGLSEWKASGETNTGGTTATISASAPVSGVVIVTITITGGPSAKLFGELVATQ